MEIKREQHNQFSLPTRIKRLGELAYNLWWIWNPEAQAVFSRIEPEIWEELHHNPVALLYKCDRARLNALASDPEYLALYDRVFATFDAYMNEESTWFTSTYPDLLDKQIAYFSFEFGLHESLPVYAGGLGVLSGDHLKEASDLGIPLIGLGFIYRQGYFMQHVSEDGWQSTGNYYLHLDEMPVIPLLNEDGKPVMISVSLPQRQVFARVWEVHVGRVSLLLLDSDVEANSQSDRQLTARLYSSDLDVRISQEILLGIGGVKAIHLLGYDPTVWHMNEGHSAFLTVQRIREYIQQGLRYDEASSKVARTNVFTTHTPVPAGIDQFPLWMIDKYFTHLWPELELDRDGFMALGRHEQPWGENFSMPVLALRLSEQCNAVSELHGQVSRKMWNFLWPERSSEDVPISYITNGVHPFSWMASRLRLCFDSYLGENWAHHLDDAEVWQKIDSIPDNTFWGVHQELKDDLIRFITWRSRRQWRSNNYHPVQILAGGVLLNNHVLTIGFARRFATYKRAYLLLQDYERLLSILNNPERPVQVIFSGKAHPADEPGKLIIQQIYRAAKDARFGGRLVFLEDYDMNIARYLVQGVDIWLNTPRPPNEASGTSGMKAAMNGVLNFSIRDGWWREGYNGENGWKIGDEKIYDDAAEQDKADAADLYDTLENQILPLYYKQQEDGRPSTEWIKRMKESIRTLAPQFSTTRMLKEYVNSMYVAAMKNGNTDS
jgi:starch phosphorylase